MKSYILIFALMFSAAWTTLSAQEDFRENPPEPAPAPEIKMGTFSEFSLDNGLQVILVENHKLPRISWQLYVDRPIIQEGDKAGILSLTASTLRSGTTSRTKAEIDEAVDFIGATLSTSSQGMYGSSLTKHQDELLDIMSDVLLKCTFPSEEFEKEKKNLLSGLQANKEDPNAISSNVTSVLVYGKEHPYGEILTEESVNKVTINDCRAYYSTYFKPNISYLVVVGDISETEAKAAAEKYFGDWKQGAVPEVEFEQPQAPEGLQVAFVPRDGSVQSVIDLTYPVDLKIGQKDGTAATMANQILGGGSTGYLFLNLREDKGYTYGAYSSLSADEEIGSFSASTSVRNEVTDSAVAEIIKEVDRIRNEKVSEDRLTGVKNKLTGAFGRGLESPNTIARYALNTKLYDLPEDYYGNYLKRVNDASVKDLQNAAKRYITTDGAYLVVVGSPDVAESLAQFDSDGQVDYYDIYGNPLDMSKTELPSGVSAEAVVENYLEAIGGSENLAGIEDMTMNMTTTFQGMNLNISSMKKAPNKVAQVVSMNGNTVNETRFDGEKALVSQMGQNQTLEGEAAAAFGKEATIFPELDYLKEEYTLELTGIEKVEGADAYKIVVTGPDGSKSTEFYEVDSGLKVKSVSSADMGGQTVTNTNVYSDYQEVDGIMIPFKMTTSGAMPMTLEMTVESVEFNTGLGEEVFKVE